MVIAGMLATLAGMGNAMFFSYVSPGLLSVLTTIDVLLMTMVGGAGTLIGPVLGAGVVEVLDTVLSSVFRHWLLIFRSEEHTSELQSRENLVCRLLLEK